MGTVGKALVDRNDTRFFRRHLLPESAEVALDPPLNVVGASGAGAAAANPEPPRVDSASSSGSDSEVSGPDLVSGEED